MKALTLHQPWASLIAVGAKTIIDRDKPTTYRGRLLIHAALTYSDRDDALEAWSAYQTHVRVDLVLGAVIASCTLLDCVPIVGWAEDPPCDHLTVNGDVLNAWAYVPDDERRIWQALNPMKRASNDGPNRDDRSDQLPFGDFTPGRFALLLDDVEAVDPPVPMKGRQGLWVPEWDTERVS